MNRREVCVILHNSNLSGEVSGKGSDWEVEFADERTYKRFKSAAKKLGETFGGYKTGYGSWVAQGNHRMSDPNA